MEEVRIDGVDVLEDLCVCMYVRWHCLYLVCRSVGFVDEIVESMLILVLMCRR